MIDNEAIKMPRCKNADALKNELLAKNPKFLAAYESLQAEYERARARIMANKKLWMSPPL
jgi:thiamine kinase-like enzyme